MTSPSADAAVAQEKKLVAERFNDLYNEITDRCRNCPDMNVVFIHKKIFFRLAAKNNIRERSVFQRAIEIVCVKQRWYPQPDDLIQVCLEVMAEDLSLPDEHQSYLQALGLSSLRGEARHPAVIYTLQAMSDQERVCFFRSDDERRAENRWHKYWWKTVEYLRKGGEIASVKKIEPEPKKPRLSKQQSLSHLSALKQTLGFA